MVPLQPDRSLALGINDAGDVVGSVATLPGAANGGYATLWQSNKVINLGSLEDRATEAQWPGEHSKAVDINDAGHVVGESHIKRTTYHAFMWDGRSMKDIGTLGGQDSSATSISNSGAITGYSQTHSGDWHAFVWINGLMTDIGTLGGTKSQGFSINAHGQVTGFATNAQGIRLAFVWKNGVMKPLSTPRDHASVGMSINSSGAIAGYAEPISPSGNGTGRAVLWVDGRMVDLNRAIDPRSGSGWKLREATGINDLGQIVGNGIGPDNWSRGFLLSRSEGQSQISCVRQ